LLCPAILSLLLTVLLRLITTPLAAVSVAILVFIAFLKIIFIDDSLSVQNDHCAGTFVSYDMQRILSRSVLD